MTTSAPLSASTIPAISPAMPWATSTIRNPSRARGAGEAMPAALVNGLAIVHVETSPDHEATVRPRPPPVNHDLGISKSLRKCVSRRTLVVSATRGGVPLLPSPSRPSPIFGGRATAKAIPLLTHPARRLSVHNTSCKQRPPTSTRSAADRLRDRQSPHPHRTTKGQSRQRAAESAAGGRRQRKWERAIISVTSSYAAARRRRLSP